MVQGLNGRFLSDCSVQCSVLHGICARVRALRLVLI